MFGVQRVLGDRFGTYLSGGLAGSLPAARLSVVEPWMWAERSNRHARSEDQ